MSILIERWVQIHLLQVQVSYFSIYLTVRDRVRLRMCHLIESFFELKFGHFLSVLESTLGLLINPFFSDSTVSGIKLSAC